MSAVCFFQNGIGENRRLAFAEKILSDDREVRQATPLASIADEVGQQVVRVEANFLRLPLFTLDNKHMRTMDGLHCEGTFRRSGKSFAFTYTVTRNTATYYPGPLARSVHFALLSIATDRGLPVQNPVTFTWRELCARIGIQTFALLTDAGVLAKVQWIESKGGLPQILLHRGPLLTAAPAADTETIEIGEDDFTLDRIEDIHTPEWQLVSAFHEAWGNESFRPSKAELDLARELLAKHGQTTMQELLPRLVKRLKIKWSDAKSFVAITRYLPEVLQELNREKHRLERERREQQQQDVSRRNAVKQAQDQAVLKTLWQSLSQAEQEEIRGKVLKGQPVSLQKRPAIVERFCLAELARRKGLAVS